MRPVVTDGFVGLAWSVCLSVGLSVTAVNLQKTSETIEMPFWLSTRVGLRNHILHGVQIPMEKGKFWGGMGRPFTPLYSIGIPSMCGGYVGLLSNCFGHLLWGRIAVLQENYWQLSILNREDTILITLSIFLSADCLNQFKMRCRNQWDLVECTLTQPGEYQWTVHMRRRCGLLSN